MNQEFPQNQQGIPQNPDTDPTAPVNPPANGDYDSTIPAAPPTTQENPPSVAPEAPQEPAQTAAQPTALPYEQPQYQQPPQAAPAEYYSQGYSYGYAPAPQPADPLYYRSFSPYTAPAPKKEKKKNKGLKIFLSILLAVMLFISGVAGGYLATNSDPENSFLGQLFNGSETTSTPAANGAIIGEKSEFSVTVEESDGTAYSYEQIVAKVSPSIVNITVYSPDGTEGSYASGIIMDAQKGYVLTNDHIYEEVAGAKFLITLHDKTEFKATFVSGDARSDIAILKIENPQNLVAATFSVDPVNAGAKVLAIGQSYGYADTVSEGIVSAANRRVTLKSGGYSEQYIQTTAAINPGNSGGALVNMSGQVIGVTSAKIASQEVEGLGFAIPSKKALEIVENLQANGRVVGRAKLGITYTQLSTIQAETNKMPVGLLIQSVDESADIGKKGVGTGDIITHVNGTEIKTSTLLLDTIEQCKAGDSLPLTVYQASTQQYVDITVVLGEAESSNSYKLPGNEETSSKIPF